jgi:hypothetical protein
MGGRQGEAEMGWRAGEAEVSLRDDEKEDEGGLGGGSEEGRDKEEGDVSRLSSRSCSSRSAWARLRLRPGLGGEPMTEETQEAGWEHRMHVGVLARISSSWTLSISSWMYVAALTSTSSLNSFSPLGFSFSGCASD